MYCVSYQEYHEIIRNSRENPVKFERAPIFSSSNLAHSVSLHLSSSHLKRDFPPYPLLPYPAHVSYAYLARGIDQPGGAAISKTRSLSAAGHHVTLPGLPFVHAGVRWGRPRSTTGAAPGRNGPVGGLAEGGNQSFAHPGGVNGARGPPRGALDPPEYVAGAPPPAERNDRIRYRRRTTATIKPRYPHVRTRCTLQIRRTCPGTLSAAGWDSTSIGPGRGRRGGAQPAHRPHKRARGGKATRSRDPPGSIWYRYI